MIILHRAILSYNCGWWIVFLHTFTDYYPLLSHSFLVPNLVIYHILCEWIYSAPAKLDSLLKMRFLLVIKSAAQLTILIINNNNSYVLYISNYAIVEYNAYVVEFLFYLMSISQSASSIQTVFNIRKNNEGYWADRIRSSHNISLVAQKLDISLNRYRN